MGRCLIIAEAGANFKVSKDPDINYRQAIKLIDIASNAGADAVKFQLYRADTLYLKKAGYADYLGKKKDIHTLIREMELPFEWLPSLDAHCRKQGIMFLCTPFDRTAVDALENLNIGMYKVASYTITHIPLLKYIAAKGRPVILSTGASNPDDIQRAISVITSEKKVDLSLLQCTAKYPTPLSALHLSAIPFLKKRFGLRVGLSDHSRDPLIAPLGAVALGACIVEKHFTTDNTLLGPDHGFAVLPTELEAMVLGIRKMEQAIGTGTKEVLPEEEELYRFARRSLYARGRISKGQIITEDQLIMLRPGTRPRGLEPYEAHLVIGKAALRNIEDQEPVDLTCVAEKEDEPGTS